MSWPKNTTAVVPMPAVLEADVAMDAPTDPDGANRCLALSRPVPDAERKSREASWAASAC